MIFERRRTYPTSEVRCTLGEACTVALTGSGMAASNAVVVIHGDQDPYASRETQRALYDALGSSAKELVVIDGSDHVAHALTRPKVQWAGAISTFLDE